MNCKHPLLKKTLPFIALVLAISANLKLNAQQSLITVNTWNAYVHLPNDYAANPTKSYPTIIFFPGIGEVGTNASLVIANGPGAYIAQGWNGNVKVGIDSIKFIVICLQPPAQYPVESAMNTRIQTLKSLYRIDPARLHLTGLSMGGWCSTTFVTGDPAAGPYTYASQVATVVEVEGVKPADNAPYPNMFDNFANAGGRLLGFEQLYDGRDILTRVNRMNSTKPNSGIFVSTNFGGGGHCCWEQFYGGYGVQPGNFMLDGKSQNIYQWMASNPLPSSVNAAPIVYAGKDTSLPANITSTLLSGTATDLDGTIKTYNWTKVSGPTQFVITNPSNPSTQLNNLVYGTYKFQFLATDDDGASGKDTITVIQANRPVPITLLGFSAKIVDQKVMLQWKTGAEFNSDYFGIERSINGQNFENIGSIKAAGNSSSAKNYFFNDELPINGVNFYRLAAFDKDATVNYSKIVSIPITNHHAFAVSRLALSANSHTLLAVISSDHHQTINMNITDASGRSYFTAPILLEKGQNNISKLIPALYNGVFYVKMVTNNELIVKPVFCEN